MNIEQNESGLLINEWQLGQQLNTAVHSGTRDKFNLLLSLLSSDARDFAEFSFKTAHESPLAEQELRDSLFLPPAKPLVNEGISIEQASSLSQDLHKKDLTSIRLKQLLSNEALLSRSISEEIPADIVDNLPFLSQKRLMTKQENVPLESKGVDADLMAQYQALDLENKPIKLTYM